MDLITRLAPVHITRN